jgi:hypothetical protein
MSKDEQLLGALLSLVKDKIVYLAKSDEVVTAVEDIACDNFVDLFSKARPLMEIITPTYTDPALVAEFGTLAEEMQAVLRKNKEE